MLHSPFGRARLRERLLEDERLRNVATALPPGAQNLLRQILRPNPVRWGNLRRTEPFSERYGFDRGTPIDRYYIEKFLARHANDVRGRVLEVRDSRYTARFGHDEVVSSDVLDIDPRNVEATIVADLAEAASLPPGRFDCFILAQTLQYVADPKVALGNALGTLKEQGVLLLTVPTISRIDPALHAIDRWRLSAAGLETLLTAVVPPLSFAVTSVGNVLTASAFIMGLAAEELSARELSHLDPGFQLMVFARVQKQAP